VRLSELSQASGLSPATIKFYLREGLLPPGHPAGPRRAEYGPAHLHRLRLARSLTELGGLPLATVRAVLAAIDDPERSLDDVLGVAHGALALPVVGPDAAEARGEVDAYLLQRGWRPAPAQAPARDALAAALVALRRLGWKVDATVFAPYAELVDRLAATELATVPASGSREQAVERAVVGTVVFESALVALRRLAHAHHSARRFEGEG
jgi:DNA-binding transcriptional MerR regulator